MKSTFNINRAIGYGILAYFFSSIFGIFLTVTMQLDFTSLEIPTYLYYIGIASSTVIVAFVSWLFFKDDKDIPNAKNGFYLGATIFLVSSVIEGILIFPVLFTGGIPIELIQYYSNPLFWVNVVAVIATASLAGHLVGQKK